MSVCDIPVKGAETKLVYFPGLDSEIIMRLKLPSTGRVDNGPSNAMVSARKDTGDELWA